MGDALMVRFLWHLGPFILSLNLFIGCLETLVNCSVFSGCFVDYSELAMDCNL